jgi:SPP1 gp7 family putative phage head morphogenesis protein
VPSLLLGQLEGVWAIVFGRREELEAAHAGAFRKIMEAVAKLDWQAVVDAVETQRLIDPSITGQQMAAEMQARVFDAVSGSLPAADRAAWTSVVQNALQAATAEGSVNAEALMAHANGAAIDWELAAEEAKAALGSGQVLGDAAEGWVQRQMQGLSYQVSQRLATLWDGGATRQEMLDGIMEILGSDQNMASVLLETAIGQSLAQGALATYATAGIPKADYVTAGDSRVCAECSGAEDGSPYDLSSCPQPPLHPRCRCTVAPAEPSTTLSLVS